MKILGVHSFVNNVGSQQALVRLARQLRLRGHEMKVIFLYGDHPVFDQEPGVEILLRKGSPSMVDYGKMILRLIGRVRREKPDVILGFLPLGMVAAALAGKLAGAPVVSSHRSPGTTYGRVLRQLDRLIGGAGGYAKTICVSQAVANSFHDYPKAYRDKLCVVHNGLEGDRPRIGRQAARAAFELNDHDLAYVAVGRLQSQKNYPYFLDQFAKTKTGTLLIAGAGPEREAIEAQLLALGISQRVRLLGDLPRTRVAALLEAGDVFVQPSLFEGQSNAVLEAMDAGLPVVLSDIPEQRETIEDDDGSLCGILVPLDDPAAWTQALDSLAEDRQLGQQLGKAAKALADRRYTVDQMAAGFERHLASAIAPRA